MHLGWLKILGILIFLWILSRIDRAQLWTAIADADPTLLALSFLTLLGSYAVKAQRWRVLVGLTGVKTTYASSWRLYNIGIFLGNLTPSNIGEFGKIPYLRRHGVTMLEALTLLTIDRFSDMAVMSVVGVVSIAILFGTQWFLAALGFACIIAFVFFYLWSHKKLGKLFPLPLTLPPVSLVLLQSAAIWSLYFAWTVLLARGLGIAVPVPELVAALTLTGLVALLPIAPAGLGARDAALLTFLAPYGVDPPHAVALSLMIFAFIMLSSVPGMGHWMVGKKGF